MAIKSLMFQYVMRNEYFKPEHSETKMYKELRDRYYRGISQSPQLLSFDEATLYFPIIEITLLFLPSFFYVLNNSFKFFGFNKWMEKFFENPVLFIFPLLTSFSFYEIIEEIKTNDINIKRYIRNLNEIQKRTQNDNNLTKKVLKTRRTLSLPTLYNETGISTPDLEGVESEPCLISAANISKKEIRRRNLSAPSSSMTMIGLNKDNDIEKVETGQGDSIRKTSQRYDPKFSVFQSNVLYMLFFLGAFTVFGLDVCFQLNKNEEIGEDTQVFLFLFVVNVILWMDFNLKTVKRRSEQSRLGSTFLELLLQYSTDTLFCIILVPIIWIRNGMR